MEVEPTTAIQPAPNTIFDIEGASAKIKQWELAKQKVLAKEDTIQIGTSTYIKRSGWRKLALAANVATTILEVKTEQEGEWSPRGTEGDFTATVKARATASWGRWAEDLGTYSASEFVSRGKDGTRLPISRHNVIARAATRAINRAVSDLIGGGVVSAEEVAQEEESAAPLTDVFDTNQLAYELRDFEGSVQITETLSEVIIKVVKNLPQADFESLRDALDKYKAVYVPFKDGGPLFRIAKK